MVRNFTSNWANYSIWRYVLRFANSWNTCSRATEEACVMPPKQYLAQKFDIKVPDLRMAAPCRAALPRPARNQMNKSPIKELSLSTSASL